jgi:hypothetical protein
VRTLTREAVAELRDKLVAAMTEHDTSIEEQLDRVFEAFRSGLGQRLAWARHRRTRRRPERRHDDPARHCRSPACPLDRRGTARYGRGARGRQFLVHLIATAALGDAIYGAQFRRSAGLAEGAETDRRSRAWLSATIRPRGPPFEPDLSSVGALAGSGFAIAAAPPNSGESFRIAAEVLKEEDPNNR